MKHKKLNLKKVTIANLGKKELFEANGGGLTDYGKTCICISVNPPDTDEGYEGIFTC
ncbi:MAG: hypothetical protein GY765_38770 [bacterium]|nr:hypothetical protein [bacterium]